MLWVSARVEDAGAKTVSAAAQRCTARADGYVRREPESTVLHRVVSEHWPRFRERAEEEGGLPRFVVRDFEEYLRCGVLEHGVVHLACSRCGHSMVVAFSCKRRGWCPSCLGRRMTDPSTELRAGLAAHLGLVPCVCERTRPRSTKNEEERPHAD